MTNTILIMVGVIILAIYLTIIMVKEKCVPPSISDTFYLCGKWWFTFVMWTECILMCIGLISSTCDSWQFLAFLSGAGLGFVGAAPHFKEDLEHTVHFAGAYTFAIASQLWAFIVVSPWLLITWAFALALILKFKKQATFIAEIACVLNIAIAMLLI